MVRASEHLESLEDCGVELEYIQYVSIYPIYISMYGYDAERAEGSDVPLSVDGIEPPQLETRQTPLVWYGRAEVSDFLFCKVSTAQSLKRVHVTQPWVQRAQWISVRPTHGHPPTLNLLDWDIFEDTSIKARIKFKYIFGNWYLTE